MKIELELSKKNLVALCLIALALLATLHHFTLPCVSDAPCQNNGICENLWGGSHNCVCTNSYTGDSCEHFLPCSNSQCSVDGTENCVDEPTTSPWNNEIVGYNAVCECKEGYTGDDCSTPIPCFSNPCQNDGECQDNNDFSDYLCDCPIDQNTGNDVFTGKNCETFMPCHENPCQNEGSCSTHPTLSDVYVCECGEGWTGDDCEVRIPCADEPCLNNGVCTDNNDFSGYSCDCKANMFTGFDNFVDQTIDMITQQFNSIDTDESGLLDHDELRQFYEKLGLETHEHTDDEIQEMIEMVDQDEDGQIDLEEFSSALSQVDNEVMNLVQNGQADFDELLSALGEENGLEGELNLDNLCDKGFVKYEIESAFMKLKVQAEDAIDAELGDEGIYGLCEKFGVEISLEECKSVITAINGTIHQSNDSITKEQFTEAMKLTLFNLTQPYEEEFYNHTAHYEDQLEFAEELYNNIN